MWRGSSPSTVARAAPASTGFPFHPPFGGTVGAILTGVFATKEINDVLNGKALGAIDGNSAQILNNALGAAIAWVLGIVGTLVILKVCDAIVGIRCDPQEEIEGLDLSMHGEEGYNLES